MDDTTWAALALVLTALGAAYTWIAWRRRGAAAGLRGVAWTLLPPAAWLTGTLKLAVEIGQDVGHWASRLVFSPTVWAGIVLAGLSVVLFGTTRAMRSRGTGVRTPARPQAGSRPAAKQVAPAAEPDGMDDGMDDDVAAILRKHGIS